MNYTMIVIPPLAVNNDIICESISLEELDGSIVSMHHHCFILTHHTGVFNLLQIKKQAEDSLKHDCEFFT